MRRNRGSGPWFVVRRHASYDVGATRHSSAAIVGLLTSGRLTLMEGRMTLPLTLIVPARNEEKFIESCLRSVMTEDVTQVLVVDGGSTDRTCEVVLSMVKDFPVLELIDNSVGKTAATGMNLGLARATGDVIVRLDAHATYCDSYLTKLASALDTHLADVTGGVFVPTPQSGTVFGRAVAASLVGRWVMGGAGFRSGGIEGLEVDTVPFGCYRASILRAVGGYNEALHRSQDYDLYERIRRAGGKIVLVPSAEVAYRARSGVWENIKYNFWNGYWVGFPRVAIGTRFAWRHFVPVIALMLCLILACIGLLTGVWLPLATAFAGYMLVPLAAAWEARRSGLAVAALIPIITLGTHGLYALGTLCGIVAGSLRAS